MEVKKTQEKKHNKQATITIHPFIFLLYLLFLNFEAKVVVIYFSVYLFFMRQ